jgi:hypothetical protein
VSGFRCRVSGQVAVSGVGFQVSGRMQAIESDTFRPRSRKRKRYNVVEDEYEHEYEDEVHTL